MKNAKDAFLLTVTYGYVRLAVRKNASDKIIR